MSFRPGARIFNNFRPFFRQPLLRRRVQTAAGPEETVQSGFAKLWNSPVGPKTVHFWCVHISQQLWVMQRALPVTRDSTASSASSHCLLPQKD